MSMPLKKLKGALQSVFHALTTTVIGSD